MEMASNQIRDNFVRVNQSIAAAIQRSRRSAADVKLVVVTKAQPFEKIRSVIDAGACYLGENYPEETVEKKANLANDAQIQWHMIGHLQSRKIPLVVSDFNAVHSIDSLELAIKLSRKVVDAGKIMPVMVEINTSGEASKYGFPGYQEPGWHELLDPIKSIADLPGIRLCGLMTMPPYFDDIEQSRPYFSALRKLRDFLQKELGENIQLKELSMGTSSDFEIAIEEGATYIRVGKAIMGERIYK